MHQPEPIPAQDACDALATLVCDAQENCCPMGSDPACRGIVIAICESAVLPLLEDPANGYDPARAGELRNLVQREADLCSPGYFPALRSAEGIFRALTGSVGGGEICSDAAGMPQPFSCRDELQSCLQNTSGNWTCSARAGEGGRCNGNIDCQSQFYCRPIPLLAGQCSARKAPGLPCNGNEECSSFACVMNLCLDPSDAAAVAQAYCQAAL